MNETTATHDVEFELTSDEKGGFLIPPDLVPALKVFLESGQAREISITGWICPRCGAVNAPDVKRYDCEPENFELPPTENYFKPLPNTVVGPSEVK